MNSVLLVTVNCQGLVGTGKGFGGLVGTGKGFWEVWRAGLAAGLGAGMVWDRHFGSLRTWQFKSV